MFYPAIWPLNFFNKATPQCPPVFRLTGENCPFGSRVDTSSGMTQASNSASPPGAAGYIFPSGLKDENLWLGKGWLSRLALI